MVKIEVENLEKTFNDKKVLKGIDFKVNKGEIIGFLGPNGAGKSTTINILTGATPRDKGNVLVENRDPEKHQNFIRKHSGIIPEREDPPSFLTVNEYLDFVSETRQTPINKEKWLKKFKLTGKESRLTKDLSKGDRQKLMLIQAFFHEPEIVFIDEPMINLDPFIQKKAKQQIQQYAENGGTVFLSTHYLSIVEDICTRTLLLKDGKISREIENPENLSEVIDVFE